MAAAPAAEGAPAAPDGSNSSAESLDRLYPAVGSSKPPRKRTTSQCKSEPPLLRTSKRTIYTAGRPPWYNEHGTQSKEAFVIGLGGGSASGKTTVATMIIEALDVPWVVLLSMDSFYKVLTKQQQEQAASNDFNFDHPDAFDFDLIIATLKKLKQGKSVKIPIYDFTTHSRKKEWKTLYGANVIIFEGIMAFADKELLKLLDLKIFVDTDSDIRLVRRLRRDISERGRDIEGVIKQYNKFVKPAFDQYIQPTMRLADIVVPRGSGNTVAIDLIVQHVHSQLEEGRPGLCPPVPPSSADPQRAEEHPSGEGHAHHHQVKPSPGAGWGSAGVGLARFGLPNPQSSTCALPRGLGTWDRGAGSGAWVQEHCWGCSQKHSLAGKRSLILPAIFLLFTLELFNLKHLKPQPVGPVQTRSRQPAVAGAALLHTAPAMCWGEHVLVPSLRFFSFPSRNKETSRDEFIFYSKRLMRLLIEHALSFLPFQSCTVQTPQGQDYEGRTYSGKQITGVSILRAGETMEPALRAVCKDVRIGTILIQTNCNTGEPELHYLRLPKDISEDHVILMDCTVSTGAAAMMAVRVLLDHDVPEDKIFLLSLLMAEMGVHSVAYAFPRVKIITTAVDKKVNDLFRIIPGIGNFGDRYFGTDAPPDWSDDEDALST
ncbi:uridine-cytidine kinase-like 1 isoform X3 [Cygnus olor]|nr:uridine-cytidine kinase-like 1 isoform X3 [Cygnus olor]